ncbi:hypothetical protein CVD28_02810 [Bacillus sp. M6-12]|uniref:hypothetical protein n=1 Tax=Bacillus sp. M6-12 TaxID=2054166 RepID=UPI000C790511|nr:hypothetical protein [Bacillus sp. M6-12]PLS19363.1 hypothetical protein CVD28_02810 [Bacillus sp. M6-12]
MQLSTNEIVDIIRTYSACEDEGVGSGIDEFETPTKLLEKLKEELKNRGATDTCGYCHQPLYVDKPLPEYKGKNFCFGRCKDLWKTHFEKKNEDK